MSEVSNSGTLLTFNRTEAGPCLGFSASVPYVHRHFAEGPGLLRMLHPGVCHYAAIPLMSSMEPGREREVQSRRLSQPSYSGPNARGVEAGNHRTDSAGQTHDRNHRRSCVSAKERDRGFQAGHSRSTTETSRKENPREKIKLGHYRKSSDANRC